MTPPIATDKIITNCILLPHFVCNKTLRFPPVITFLELQCLVLILICLNCPVIIVELITLTTSPLGNKLRVPSKLVFPKTIIPGPSPEICNIPDSV